MKKALLIFSIIAAFFLLLYAVLVISIGNMAKQDTKVKSDAIIVLGEGAYGGIPAMDPYASRKDLSHTLSIIPVWYPE